MIDPLRVSWNLVGAGPGVNARYQEAAGASNPEFCAFLSLVDEPMHASEGVAHRQRRALFAPPT